MTRIRTFRTLFLTILFSIALQFFATWNPQPVAAQHVCGMTAPGLPDVRNKWAHSEPGGAPRAIESHTGAHLPTEGTIRALVLFAQSKDDNYQSATWPNGAFPLWADSLMHALREYFRFSSNNRLEFQFDVFPRYLISQKSEREYLEEGKRYGDFMKDLFGELDAEMDFAEYDNWQTMGRPFRSIPGPDGTVDLVMVFHRSVLHPGWMPHTGVADLMYADNFFVDGNTRRIYGGTGFNDDAGASGLIVTGFPGKNAVLDYETALTVTIHEMQHKLFTDVHTTDSFAKLGVMSSNASGYAMCAIERHFLGYISIPLLSYNADTVITLKDYVTTGDAVAIPMVANHRFYYILEYRTKTHKYDSAPEEGVFIYRIDDNASMTQKQILVVTSDGQWDWKLNETTGVIERDTPNALSGYNPLQKIVIHGASYWHSDYRGYEGIAFTPARSPMGMYRNPASDFILRNDTIRTGLTVSVLDMDGNEARVLVTHTPPMVVSSDGLDRRSFALGAPYPNPASASSGVPITFPYTLTRESDVMLTVYDRLGRAVFERTSPNAVPGTEAFHIPVSALSPGAYTCRLRSAEGSSYTQIIITR